MADKKTRKTDNPGVERDLERIDKLFRELEKDKTLPTFGDHFMLCLTLGIAENVNLKKMYPKTYIKLSLWLEEHNRRIEK